MNLSFPGLYSLLDTTSIQNPAEEQHDRKFEERMTTTEGNHLSDFIPRQTQVPTLRDKSLVRAAGRAGLHWFGVFPPVGSSPELKDQP